jgi:hypothetical protein
MSGLAARSVVEDAVRRELFGPAPDEPPRGQPLDCASGKLQFPTREAARGLWYDAATGQEVLTGFDPLRRYGIGVLHSGGADRSTAEDDLTWVSGLGESEEEPDEDTPEITGAIRQDVADPDDFDLTDANSFKPRAMALSFKCRVPAGSWLAIELTGAYYDRLAVQVPDSTRPWEWWVRRPIHLTGSVSADVLRQQVNRLVRVTTAADGEPRITPTVQVFSRPVPGEPDPELRLVTLAVVNTAAGSGPTSALFQIGFTASAASRLIIEPYPEADRAERDEEEQSIDLLYRKRRTFAIGHGCAADWTQASEEVAAAVSADPLPAYEVVSLTPDVWVTESDGTRRRVVVSMDDLANDSAEGQAQVQEVLTRYAAWINDREAEIATLADRFQPAATGHIAKCREALERMQAGWQLAQTDTLAARAFQLANRAMLFQQVRSGFDLRPVVLGSDGTVKISGSQPTPSVKPGKGNWRPFQIAFILASLPELIDRALPVRELVDLIFFPTGGGKTEAYLGASAISLVARRLRDPADAGTDILMRYTLRLLTAQQFLRAAALICVLEDIRSNETDLGEEPFGIGIWLGGESTPNTWGQAIKVYGELQRNDQAPNKFLLLRCPWCGAQMGPQPYGRNKQIPVGYVPVGTKKIVFRCPDHTCRFGGRATLPVHVVDDDIYQARPSLVIGTVDKFAMMAWRPEARRIFGIGNDGDREVSPPGLIIQDELHLISGPLGSMVGLYEPVIDDLCSDRRHDPPIPAKIIASTATIRRYEDQIRGLFGREQVALFPPHGLEEGHSFFAEPAVNDDGAPQPGRRYVGVLSASLGSTQTVQVRVAAATLQAGLAIEEADRDGYWTNLNFLNSLRELGNTVSLLQSDIPDYLTGLKRWEDLDTIRWPKIPMELTSRRRSDEIPRAIEQLQTPYGSPGCVDICLASNIIEVGVDIERLGLMTIVGQPKTTAQYIQVSGRIGRNANVSPGLVITIYGAAKPRDRSHYERFRTYHQQLYAQVEPTSVTPFAAPVLRRALHAAAVSHIRQTAPADQEPYPFPEGEYDAAIELLRQRARIADAGELPTLERVQRERARQWRYWDRTVWSANTIGGDPQQGLMRYAGTLPELSSKATIWDVPTSMRNVDAECRLQISLAYNREAAETEETAS